MVLTRDVVVLYGSFGWWACYWLLPGDLVGGVWFIVDLLLIVLLVSLFTRYNIWLVCVGLCGWIYWRVWIAEFVILASVFGFGWTGFCCVLYDCSWRLVVW